MNYYVADTHALYWHLTKSAKLGPRALAAFEEGERGEAHIYIPSILLAELHYVNEKQNRPLNFATVFKEFDDGSQFTLIPFDAADVLRFDRDHVVTEMHDRIVVGVALKLKAPIITVDAKIVSTGLADVVW